MTKKAVLILCLLIPGLSFAQNPCRAIHLTGSSDTLAAVSEFYFGAAVYGRAILMATNARSGADGLKYIGTPDKLPASARLCIPDLQEAARRKSLYDAYERSVREAVLPHPSDVSNALMKVDPAQPIRVVSWIRADEVARYQPNGLWITTATKDMWVTVIPEIKDFCQKFAKDYGRNTEQLTLRLEQRLGLPPGAAKTTFLEITVKDMFRPCQDPSITTANCQAGPPADANEKYVSWFYRQYYGSYAQAQPDQYPWTALGYTFDWAPSGAGFVRYGASEFVIPKGTAIEIEGSADTAKYCAPNTSIPAAGR